MLNKAGGIPLLVLMVDLVNGSILITCKEILRDAITTYEDQVMPGTLSLHSAGAIFFGLTSYDKTTFMRLNMFKNIPTNGINSAAYAVRTVNSTVNCKGVLSLLSYGPNTGPGKALLGGKVK